ncbi:MAG: ABC transporter permease [Myxococcales bacterium]|nr:ABC transporter permease [Myxococcales bacterium]
MSRSRFQIFVALRYLMAHPIHVSWIAVIVAIVAFVTGGALTAVGHFVLEAPNPRSLIETGSPYRQDVLSAGAIAFAVSGVCVYVFLIRIFFTFYSTVSIVGVSIGCAALVTVLSVMNGFEGDLRSKILGSNAHVQVSKDDGEFVEWEEVRARIDRVPGVVASTPFATSEVVIAANSNYSNVVVKGIDVASAVEVTSLRKSLDDPEALDRLEPLVGDGPEAPAVAPAAPPTGDVIDPAPDDLPSAGDPIDWSDPTADPPAFDPAPPDFADGADALPDAAPRDLSEDAPPPELGGGGRPPSRVSTLSGVLVGKELVKQMHLFTGQEVRMVSPLADPMNPDANGTPIPFNRDYRVAGQFFTGMYEYDLKLVYVTLDSLQRFLRLGDAVDGIEVRISDPDDVDALVKRISTEIGPAYHVQGWRELNRNLFSALKLEKIAMFMILAIIIIVASFSIVGTLIMTVIEKARQIALLKTLGASDLGIVAVFVTQGSLIGFIGGTLGVAIGLGLCAWLKAFGFPINPDVYYIDRLPVQIDLATVGLVYIAALVISFAATIYPSVLGSQLRPAVGLKK